MFPECVAKGSHLWGVGGGWLAAGYGEFVFVYWVVATQIFWNFHPYLGKIPILTIIFFKGVETT